MRAIRLLFVLLWVGIWQVALADVPTVQRGDLVRTGRVLTSFGGDLPGIELGEKAPPRFSANDSTVFALGMYNDAHWPLASTVVPLDSGEGYWLRYRLRLQDLGPEPELLLTFRSALPMVLFINGRAVWRSEANGAESTTLPVTFRGDGEDELIAVHVLEGVAKQLPSFRLNMPETLHTAQRDLLHFGVFIGINGILFLLALILGLQERRGNQWPLLSLLCFLMMLQAWTDADDMLGDLGLPDKARLYLIYLRALLYPWPSYLLILVMARMHGGISLRARWRWGIAAAVMSVIAVGVMVASGADGSKPPGAMALEVNTATDGYAYSIAVLSAVLFTVVVLVGFLWWVLRLGFGLLRGDNKARWLGGGALVSHLFSLGVGIAAWANGEPVAVWMDTLAMYGSYAAVPVALVVHLALRSAHDSRLVARQRDELDEEVKQRTAELRAEKERSDELLLNILPADVADELKRTGKAEAREFAQATVLFTDFKGFTATSADIGPTELVAELNACFEAFDRIIGTRGIEKIKTIGDAYMCAGGLPDPASSTPLDVVLAALEMQEFMQQRAAERRARGLWAFDMRVGIHAGPVVAGIVGVKKFQYDIWGDTVNTASRMESASEVHRVNISEATYALVKDVTGLRFTERGALAVKGIGDQRMYFVERA